MPTRATTAATAMATANTVKLERSGRRARFLKTKVPNRMQASGQSLPQTKTSLRGYTEAGVLSNRNDCGNIIEGLAAARAFQKRLRLPEIKERRQLPTI